MFSAMVGANFVTSCSADTRSDWVQVSAGSEFSLWAPAGTKFIKRKGIDSFVGEFEGPGFNLRFDYGAYANPLDNDGNAQAYETEDLMVGDNQARLVTSYAPQRDDEFPYFIGMHFGDLGETVIGTRKLTISARVKGTEDYALVKEIFSTIRFN
jgi:hypothetical protein